MYQDYIITAIFLLIVALVIGGLTIRRYNIPYLYFLGGTLIGATFFVDPVLIGNTLFPFFIRGSFPYYFWWDLDFMVRSVPLRNVAINGT